MAKENILKGYEPKGIPNMYNVLTLTIRNIPWDKNSCNRKNPVPLVNSNPSLVNQTTFFL